MASGPGGNRRPYDRANARSRARCVRWLPLCFADAERDLDPYPGADRDRPS
jgi:hypothetical protein